MQLIWWCGQWMRWWGKFIFMVLLRDTSVNRFFYQYADIVAHRTETPIWAVSFFLFRRVCHLRAFKLFSYYIGLLKLCFMRVDSPVLHSLLKIDFFGGELILWILARSCKLWSKFYASYLLILAWVIVIKNSTVRSVYIVMVVIISPWLCSTLLDFLFANCVRCSMWSSANSFLSLLFLLLEWFSDNWVFTLSTLCLLKWVLLLLLLDSTRKVWLFILKYVRLGFSKHWGMLCRAWLSFFILLWNRRAKQRYRNFSLRLLGLNEISWDVQMILVHYRSLSIISWNWGLLLL